MKNLITKFLIFGLLISCSTKSESEKTSNISKEINIENLEKKGFKVYQESPSKAITIFKQVALEYEKQQNFTKAGFTNLNIANIYDEHKSQFDSALFYAEKSLNIWEIQKDTMQIANLYKYIGLLQGRIGQFVDAEYHIQNAIKMYDNLEFHSGIAVSEFNLADMYFQKKEYNNSIKYFNKAKDFWYSQNDNGRIYANNILGIRIFNTTNNESMVENLIKENRKIEKESDINHFTKKSFDKLITEIKKKPAANRVEKSDQD